MIRRKLLNNGNEHLPMSGIPLQGTTNLYNADEDRFSDANWPRDANGFKIIPGQQMNKWWWRDSMKDTYLNQAIIKGAVLVPGTLEGTKLNLFTPYQKKQYSPADFNEVLWYEWADFIFNNDRIRELIWDRKAEIYWKPPIIVKDWGVIITRNGTYIVQFYADFIFPKGHNTKEIQKEWLYLYINWIPWVRVSNRSCFSTDGLSGFYIWGMKSWTVLNIGSAHTFYNENALCLTALNIVQTG